MVDSTFGEPKWFPTRSSHTVYRCEGMCLKVFSYMGLLTLRVLSGLRSALLTSGAFETNMVLLTVRLIYYLKSKSEHVPCATSF